MRTTTSLLALVLVLPTSAGAATIRVPEDYATIYEAVDAAAAGDSVVVGPGTWTERDTRTVTMNGFSVTARAHAFLKPFLTVVGSGLDATILQGDEPAPGIGNLVLAYPDSYPGGLVTITGLTLRGVAGGDYLGYQGTGHGIVALEGCLVENHLSGIVMDNADLVMRNCIVRENHGNEHFAAAIQARSVDVDLEDCLFEGNVGENFGVVYNACVGLCGTTIRNCRFVANESPRVVLLTNQRPLEFEGCWFEGNVSSGTGGTCLLAGN